MEHNILFLALSKAILTSLAQGMIIYLIIRYLLNINPAMPAEKRYKIFYAALILIFTGFIIVLGRFYLEGIEKAGISLPEDFTSMKGNTGAILLDTGRISANYSVWIAGLYFLGLFIQSIFLLKGLYRIQKISKDYTLASDHFWNVRIEQLRNKMKIDKELTLFLSEKMLIPFTSGFIKPMILFPVALLNRLSEEQVEAILLHEMAHIKRHDYLFNILQRIMEIVLFFNPMVWLLAKDIRREREFCCDDLVIDYSANAGIYAHALLQIAEIKLNTLTLSLSASGEGKYPLLKRIKRITAMKNLNSNPKNHLFTLLGIAAVCLSIAWAVPSQDTIIRKKTYGTKVSELPEAPVPPARLVLKASAALPELSELPAIPEPPAPPVLPALAVPLAPLSPIPPAPLDTNKLKSKFNSPEWKKQMEEMRINAEEMKKKFDSPEWKKQMEEMKANADEIKKKFDSPEWKKQMEEMKANAEEIKKKFDSPEWKKQMESMKIQAEQMKKKFDSPEWKQKVQELQKYKTDTIKRY